MFTNDINIRGKSLALAARTGIRQRCFNPVHDGVVFPCSCCGAGVAADAEITTQIMASNVELHTLNTGRPPLVAMVTRQLKQMLFR